MAKLMVCIEVPYDYEILKKAMKERSLLSPHMRFKPSGRVTINQDILAKHFDDVKQTYGFELIGVRP